MIFRSELVKAQWDTWAYYHRGTYYLYYLITEDSPGEGFGVATSKDGVHWQDRGWALCASDHMVTYLGTGAVWKSPEFERTGRFICNYSEHRRQDDGQITQNILFAWSTDLIHWIKYTDEWMFGIDVEFYEKYGRWDCIFPMPRAEGGYHGIWTATPKGSKGVGLGYSEDGVRWVALPPPGVVPGVDEAGAFWRFGDRIYAMFGVSGTGMVTYVADNVTGRSPARSASGCWLAGVCSSSTWTIILSSAIRWAAQMESVSGSVSWGMQRPMRLPTFASGRCLCPETKPSHPSAGAVCQAAGGANARSCVRK